MPIAEALTAIIAWRTVTNEILLDHDPFDRVTETRVERQHVLTFKERPDFWITNKVEKIRSIYTKEAPIMGVWKPRVQYFNHDPNFTGYLDKGVSTNTTWGWDLVTLEKDPKLAEMPRTGSSWLVWDTEKKQYYTPAPEPLPSVPGELYLDGNTLKERRPNNDPASVPKTNAWPGQYGTMILGEGNELKESDVVDIVVSGAKDTNVVWTFPNSGGPGFSIPTNITITIIHRDDRNSGLVNPRP